MPKPKAGWTTQPIHAPKPYIAPKQEAPDRSWWIGLSREAFQVQLAEEFRRMNCSRTAAYLHPSARVGE